MEINISKIAQALEKTHSHATTDLLMLLLMKDKDRYFTPRYEDLVNELKPVLCNLGLDLNELIQSSNNEEPVYDSESFIIPTPTFQEYLSSDLYLQREVAREFGWPEDDSDPEWIKVAKYIYNVYYKPMFGPDIEWESRD